MQLDSFLRDMNIDRFRRLLDSTKDEVFRKTLLELLAQEQAKLDCLTIGPTSGGCMDRSSKSSR